MIVHVTSSATLNGVVALIEDCSVITGALYARWWDAIFLETDPTLYAMTNNDRLALFRDGTIGLIADRRIEGASIFQGHPFLTAVGPFRPALATLANEPAANETDEGPFMLVNANINQWSARCNVPIFNHLARISHRRTDAGWVFGARDHTRIAIWRTGAWAICASDIQPDRLALCGPPYVVQAADRHDPWALLAQAYNDATADEMLYEGEEDF